MSRRVVGTVLLAAAMAVGILVSVPLVRRMSRQSGTTEVL